MTTSTDSPDAIHVVLVEDLPVIVEDVTAELRDAFSEIRIDVISCEFDFREALPSFAADPPTVFIVDVMLPWATPRKPMPTRPPDAETSYRAGLRCIAALQSQPTTRAVPVIVHSALDAINIGAWERMAPHVLYARQGGDLAALVRAVLRTTRDLPHRPQRVFVVHGHQKELRQSVVDLLSARKLEPVVLLDSVETGPTFIEMLERERVDFAVVLLTGDDVGKSRTDRKLSPRARENVIFELGFFIARLGRDRVCALYEDGMEIPSNYKTVKCIPLDYAGQWREKLDAALNAARIALPDG
jgi:predicted nucleotide-binding protein